MCRLSGNLEASTSCHPQGLSRDCFTFAFIKWHDMPTMPCHDHMTTLMIYMCPLCGENHYQTTLFHRWSKVVLVLHYVPCHEGIWQCVTFMTRCLAQEKNSPWCSLNCRLDRPTIWSGLFREKKNLLPVLKIEQFHCDQPQPINCTNQSLPALLYPTNWIHLWTFTLTRI